MCGGCFFYILIIPWYTNNCNYRFCLLTNILHVSTFSTHKISVFPLLLTETFLTLLTSNTKSSIILHFLLFQKVYLLVYHRFIQNPVPKGPICIMVHAPKRNDLLILLTLSLQQPVKRSLRNSKHITGYFSSYFLIQPLCNDYSCIFR